ncbi:MAG TPA: bifunctional DNA-formamidopyrimidine glycosylase/DNA-(apurinic or apyrimidinic site) lyase [Verrucomicrobiae bacterium]|jgi:formamidopyrimidine-DNA glycosylase
MPELPEVEILARHLRPLLRGKTIRGVEVRRMRASRPTTPKDLQKAVSGATFNRLLRRGKYLVFELSPPPQSKTRMRRTMRMIPLTLLGHLGMTGRMFLALKKEPLPKHAAIVFDLGCWNFVYEDFRYFGRMTLDLSSLENLGPEPLGKSFSPQMLVTALKNSRQSIKVKLLDQAVVAGIGNIYASEALFRARVSPKLPANELSLGQSTKLCRAIRDVLNEAIKYGSTIHLKTMSGKSDALFYFSDDGEGFYETRLRVYDRAGKPCLNCGTAIKRITQAARSTFFCPRCQKA